MGCSWQVPPPPAIPMRALWALRPCSAVTQLLHHPTLVRCPHEHPICATLTAAGPLLEHDPQRV